MTGSFKQGTGTRAGATPVPRRNHRRRWLVCAISAATMLIAVPGAAEYTGPLIDAHSHVPDARAIEAYVAAMQRNNVDKVLLLGVGGIQKSDPAFIAAAVKKHPDRVIPGLPLPDPQSAAAAARRVTSRCAAVATNRIGSRSGCSYAPGENTPLGSPTISAPYVPPRTDAALLAMYATGEGDRTITAWHACTADAIRRRRHRRDQPSGRRRAGQDWRRARRSCRA